MVCNSEAITPFQKPGFIILKIYLGMNSYDKYERMSESDRGLRREGKFFT